MGSLYKNIQLMLVFLKAPFYSFLLYINDLSNDVICNIAIYDDAILLSTLSMIRHLICCNN